MKVIQEWKVLPPEIGHPMPSLGWRLLKRVVIVSPLSKRNKIKWVCVMMGHEVVITRILQGLNVGKFKENNITMISDPVEILPSLQDKS